MRKIATLDLIVYTLILKEGLLSSLFSLFHQFWLFYPGCSWARRLSVHDVGQYLVDTTHDTVTDGQVWPSQGSRHTWPGSSERCLSIGLTRWWSNYRLNAVLFELASTAGAERREKSETATDLPTLNQLRLLFTDSNIILRHRIWHRILV